MIRITLTIILDLIIHSFKQLISQLLTTTFILIITQIIDLINQTVFKLIIKCLRLIEQTNENSWTVILFINSASSIWLYYHYSVSAQSIQVSQSYFCFLYIRWLDHLDSYCNSTLWMICLRNSIKNYTDQHWLFTQLNYKSITVQ